jgi:hypothetical protein
VADPFDRLTLFDALVATIIPVAMSLAAASCAHRCVLPLHNATHDPRTKRENCQAARPKALQWGKSRLTCQIFTINIPPNTAHHKDRRESGGFCGPGGKEANRGGAAATPHASGLDALKRGCGGEELVAYV